MAQQSTGSAILTLALFIILLSGAGWLIYQQVTIAQHQSAPAPTPTPTPGNGLYSIDDQLNQLNSGQ